MQGMLGYLVLLHLLVYKVRSQPGDICQNQDFVANCGTGEVIVMTSAKYGRFSTQSPCVEISFGFLGCERDVLMEADSMCSGRRECKIHIPNTSFDRIQPCPTDLKAYLQPAFQCLKVVHSQLQTCPSSNQVVLKEPVGHLASVWTQETDMGSRKCPYVIQGPPGTVIKFTLFDFARNESSRHRTYANIKDSTRYSVYEVRGGAQRESHVYTSVSSWVQVRMFVTRSTNFYFILKYELTGCPDPVTNVNTWARREHSKVTLGCKNSDDQWTAICENNVWKGKLENCSMADTGHIIGPEDKPPLSHRMSLVLIITIALALGSIILAIGIFILKWKRGHPSQYSMYHQQHQQQHANLKLGDTVSRDPYMDPNLPPPSPRDYNYGKENEYAYISDFPPPPIYDVDNKRSTIEERQMELYQARQCVLPYGTYAQSPDEAKVPSSKTVTPASSQQKKHGPNIPVSSGFPPAYYELDTDRQVEGEKQRASATGGSFKRSGPSGIPEVPSTPSAYDHLINTGCMSNHKSV